MEAQIRIGLNVYERNRMGRRKLRRGNPIKSGSYSWVGIQNEEHTYDPTARYTACEENLTMNIGWISAGVNEGTAEHEVGHALGFDHEHQHPRRGFEWDEPRVIEAFRRSQGWSEADVRFQVIDQIDPQIGDIGDVWDPASIMHYSFNSSLILSPPEYKANGIPRNFQISELDKQGLKLMYPADSAPSRTSSALPASASSTSPSSAPLPRPQALPIWKSVELSPDESDTEFTLAPDISGQYEIRLVGSATVSIVVSAQVDGEHGAQKVAKKELTDGTAIGFSLLRTSCVSYTVHARIVKKEMSARCAIIAMKIDN